MKRVISFVILLAIIFTMYNGVLMAFAEQLPLEPVSFEATSNITVQNVKDAVKTNSLANYKDKEKFINAFTDDGQKFGDLVDIALTNMRVMQNNEDMIIAEGEALNEVGMVYYALMDGGKVTVKKTKNEKSGVRYYYYAYEALSGIINKFGLGLPSSLEYLPFGVKINTDRGEFIYTVKDCVDTYGPKVGSDYYLLKADTVYTYESFLKWETTQEKNREIRAEQINVDKTDAHGEKIVFNVFEKIYQATFNADIDGENKSFEWGFCKYSIPLGLGSSTMYGMYYSLQPNKYYVATGMSYNTIVWGQTYLVVDNGDNLKETCLDPQNPSTKMKVIIDSNYKVTRIELLFADMEKGSAELKKADVDMTTYQDNGNFKKISDYGYKFSVGEVKGNPRPEPKTQYVDLNSNHKPLYEAEFEIAIDSEQQNTWIGELSENGSVKCKITYFSTYGFQTGRTNESMVTLSGNGRKVNLMEYGYNRHNSFVRYSTGYIGLPGGTQPTYTLQKSGIIELNWKTSAEYSSDKQLTAKVYDSTYIEDGSIILDKNGNSYDSTKIYVGKIINITQKGDMIDLSEVTPTPTPVPTPKPIEESTNTPSANTFADVPTDHWAFDEIQYFYNAGVIAGIGDKTFAPDRNVTREEFAKLLAVIFTRTQTSATEQTFSDVTADMWSYNYIEGVKEFLTGYYPTGAQPFFNPQAKAVREDIAYSLVKIIGLDKNGLKDKAVFDKFTDSDDISPSIKEFVGIAMEKSLIRGYEDNTFRPNLGITRAETAVLLFRALKAPVNTSPDPTTAPTPVPSTNYQYIIFSNNIERISGYSGENISGTLLLKWSPKANKALFTANLKAKNGPFDYVKCDVSLVELSSCTADKINGYFEIMLDNKTRDAKIKGTINIKGTKLTLSTEEYDYNLIATECKLAETEQPNEEVTPEQTDEEKNDNEEIWYDAKSVYSSKPGFFKGEGVNGEISGYASVDYSIYEKAVRFRAEVNVKTVTDGDKKFEITLADTKSFSDSEIIGTFNIICNNEIIADNVSGSITNIDGNLNEKMIFRTDDNVWSLKMCILERTL